MSAISYIGVSNIVATNGAAPTAITPNASTQTGDLMIFYHYGRAGGGETVSLSGWTEIKQGVDITRGHSAAFWRIRQAGDSTYTATVTNYTSANNGESIVEWIETFRSHDPNNPIVSSSTLIQGWPSLLTLGGTGPDDIDPPAIASILPEDMVIVFSGRQENITGQTTLTGDNLTWTAGNIADTTLGADVAAVTQRGLNETTSTQTVTGKVITTTGTAGAGSGWMFSIRSLRDGSVTESASASDTTDASISGGLSGSVTESSATSDSLTVSASFSTSVTESASSQDTLTGGVTLPVSVTESSSVTESTTTSVSVSVTEALTSSDSITVTNNASGSITESSALSESVTGSATILTSVTESLTTSESITTSLSVSVTESSAISESLTGSLSTSASATESSSLADSVTVSVSYTLSTSESSSASDAATGSNVISSSSSESISSSDSVTVSVTASGSVTESSATSDSVTVSASLSVSVTESSSASDSASSAAPVSGDLTESTSAGESATVSRSTIASISESSFALVDEQFNTAPVRYIGVSNLVTTNGGVPAAITPSASTNVGDLMIFYHYSRATGGNETVTVPSGFTEIFNSLLANSGLLAIAYRFEQAGDTSFTATITNHTSGATGETVLEWIESYRNADPTNPIKAIAARSNWASSLNIGPISPPTDTAVRTNDLVVVVGGRFENITAQTTLSGDGLLWTQRTLIDTTLGTDAAAVTQTGLNDEAVAPTVNVTSKTITTTGTAQTGIGTMFTISRDRRVYASEQEPLAVTDYIEFLPDAGQVVNESSSASDSLSASNLISQSISESSASSASESASNQTSASVSESSSAAESISSSNLIPVSVSESSAASESIDGVASGAGSISESTSSSDFASGSSVRIASASEFLLTADSITGSSLIPVSVSESSAASDSITTVVSVSVSESLLSSDSASGASTRIASSTESSSVSESISVTSSFLVSVTESSSVSDSLTTSVTASISESASSSDSVTGSSTRVASSTETSSASESLAGASTRPATITESSSAQESLSVTRIAGASSTESLSAQDSISGSKLISVSVTDGTNTDDSIQTIISISISDILTTSDQADGNIGESVFDSSGVIDVCAASMVAVRRFRNFAVHYVGNGWVSGTHTIKP